MVNELESTYGFVSLADLVEAIGDGEGPAAASRFGEDFQEALVASFQGGRPPVIPIREDASNVSDEVLASIPDDWFAFAATHGRDLAVAYIDPMANPGATHGALTSRIDELFTRTGVPYGFDESDKLVRRGDPDIATAAIQPALSALDDARLTAAQRHFQAALVDLRRDDAADAIDEARQVVEAALLALLDDHDHPRPPKHQAQQLFDTATAAGLLPQWGQELVLAAPRFRGRTIAGHAGRPEVSTADAEACVGAAAAAVLYVASHLR